MRGTGPFGREAAATDPQGQGPSAALLEAEVKRLAREILTVRKCPRLLAAQERAGLIAAKWRLLVAHLNALLALQQAERDVHTILICPRVFRY